MDALFSNLRTNDEFLAKKIMKRIKQIDMKEIESD